jgi:hypothetical protein
MLRWQWRANISLSAAGGSFVSAVSGRQQMFKNIELNSAIEGIADSEFLACPLREPGFNDVSPTGAVGHERQLACVAQPLLSDPDARRLSHLTHTLRCVFNDTVNFDIG